MVIGDKLITDFIGLEEALNKLNRVYTLNSVQLNITPKGLFMSLGLTKPSNLVAFQIHNVVFCYKILYKVACKDCFWKNLHNYIVIRKFTKNLYWMYLPILPFDICLHNSR